MVYSYQEDVKAAYYMCVIIGDIYWGRTRANGPKNYLHSTGLSTQWLNHVNHVIKSPVCNNRPPFCYSVESRFKMIPSTPINLNIKVKIPFAMCEWTKKRGKKPSQATCYKQQYYNDFRVWCGHVFATCLVRSSTVEELLTTTTNVSSTHSVKSGSVMPSSRATSAFTRYCIGPIDVYQSVSIFL